MKLASTIGVLAVASALAGCVAVPTGPSTAALPGTNKGYDQFQHDDGACRQYAYDSVGGQTAARAQEESAARSVLAGAVIGALIGGAVTGSGHGAAVGAGVGGATGGLAGVPAADASAYEAQRRYDQAYTQCMYGRGHRVAVSGRAPGQAPAQQGYPPPPPPRRSYGPPPNSGYAPPPPPPGYGSPPPPQY